MSDLEDQIKLCRENEDGITKIFDKYAESKNPTVLGSYLESLKILPRFQHDLHPDASDAFREAVEFALRHLQGNKAELPHDVSVMTEVEEIETALQNTLDSVTEGP